MMFSLAAPVPAGVQKTDQQYEQLLAAIAGGNTNALAEFYTRTKSAVYGFALSILKNAQNAEDVMQDTYIKVYYAADTYQPLGKPMAWVLTIVRNLSLMKLREKASQNAPLADDWRLADKTNLLEECIDREVLTAAFTVLSEPERQIIILHSVAGLKHREIADLMNIPLSTVISKYNRALSKLKNTLKEEA